MDFDYIRQFEKLGVGLFVHFGLYSVLGMGEWYQYAYNADKEKYEKLVQRFNVKKNWARDLVKTAKKMGARYIVITSRHHDGFSLYDTCGLNNFDAVHSASKRDLIKEFVDECHKENIIPFFYHTLLDWHNTDYQNDFPKYIDYLVKSVEILCKNYGKIGGFWFDGYWDKPNADWQFDRLYKTIRKYQPTAIITNNTGLNNEGAVTHKEIDCVTFERGKPFNVSNKDGKDRAGEVCESINDHWGHANKDLNYKSIPDLIDLLIDCRKYGINLLLNVGPLGNGGFDEFEKQILLKFGKWIQMNKHLVFDCRPSSIEADNADIFSDDEYYYAVMKDVPMSTNENVTRRTSRPEVVIHTKQQIKNASYMDTKIQNVEVDKKNNSFPILPFPYGTSLYARVVKFKLK